MDLFTKSATILCDYTLHLYLENGSRIDDNTGFGSRYRFVCIDRGAGTFSLNGAVVPFIAPVALCLSERDRVSALPEYGCHALTLYFLPAVINSKLTLEVINNLEAEFTQTERTDLFCIRNFQTKQTGNKVIQLGPADEVRVKGLLVSIKSILDNPVQQFWPCLARSYLIELLNFLHRLNPLSIPVCAGIMTVLK